MKHEPGGRFHVAATEDLITEQRHPHYASVSLGSQVLAEEVVNRIQLRNPALERPSARQALWAATRRRLTHGPRSGSDGYRQPRRPGGDDEQRVGLALDAMGRRLRLPRPSPPSRDIAHRNAVYGGTLSFIRDGHHAGRPDASTACA